MRLFIGDDWEVLIARIKKSDLVTLSWDLSWDLS